MKMEGKVLLLECLCHAIFLCVLSVVGWCEVCLYCYYCCGVGVIVIVDVARCSAMLRCMLLF
jgi:hypothetical protein